MRTRLISAIILAAAASAAIYFGGWVTLAVYGLAMLIAAYEYFNMTRLGGHKPMWVFGLVLIAALFVNATFHPALPFNVVNLILVIAVAVPPLFELTRKDHTGFLLSWSLMLLGVVYIGLLGSYLFELRNLQQGAALLFIPLLTTWFTDILAYMAGRAWGKNPFFPDISPKKTREGAIGGLVAGTLTFSVLGTVFGMPIWAAVFLGVAISILTTAGDLTESLIKRNLGVKDSGTLIAGHGGMFDRLDSMFIPLTFAFYFFTIVLGYR